MSADPVLKHSDVSRMLEEEERRQRWLTLYYAANEYLSDGGMEARENLVRAINALEERR